MPELNLIQISSEELLDETRRQMTVCNSCRYCEGYCAVFPAMELRRTFTDGDLNYLANLCFDCRACLYACQFAPPHPFDVNVPKVFSELRTETYKRYAWPGLLRPMLDKNVLSISLVLIATIAAAIVTAIIMSKPGRMMTSIPGVANGSFYEIIPFSVMVGVMTAISLYAVLIFIVGALLFWRDTGGKPAELMNVPAMWKATQDAFNLRYLKGGGPDSGCYYPADRRSMNRRIYHQLVFYGFILDVIATTLAAIWQDIFHLMPPFSLTTFPDGLPTWIGSIGGIMLIIGTVGMLQLKWISDRLPAAQRMMSMDIVFIVMLNLSASTGMVLLIFRETAAMALLLAVHLGVVAALYFTAPYGKFAHVVYRYAALIKNGIEQRRVALAEALGGGHH